MEKRYQVFVSSTYNDLINERKEVIQALLNAKHIPAGMEMFSASNDEQFEYIKKIIDNCDYYVLIIAARYGSMNISTGKSFTEQEYEYALSKNIPILTFLHSDPENLPSEKRESINQDKLAKFRMKTSKNRMCRKWSNIVELVGAVITSLNEEISNNPQKGWVRGNYVTESDGFELLSQINNLRIENDKLKNDSFNRVDFTSDNIFDNDIILYKNKSIKWNEIFTNLALEILCPLFYDDFLANIKSQIMKATGLGKITDEIIKCVLIKLHSLALIEINVDKEVLNKNRSQSILEIKEEFRYVQLTNYGKEYLYYLNSKV